VTAQRLNGTPDVPDTVVANPLETPDGVPIEELPGWDAGRGVFVLDRSRTAAAGRRLPSRRERAAARTEPVSPQRRP
jgi:hypothetical protein